ncbi:MAG: monovalent cation:proton antiporter-2 (CPA2) family protein [Pseudomonadales bacterium]|nr:monovalent cation:proton antiporter-2 (CPA2) family protein [Pseudomonadales bacterium]
MAVEGAGATLTPIVTLLAAAVLAVPLFRRLGLGSVLGYFCAGLAIGPFGLALFTDPAAILHVSELGVVMFLFIIGLEMKPKRLWALRGQIFGLGLLQVAVCAALLTGAASLLGIPPLVAFIAGTGFVLSSTAVVVQVLEERGEIATPHGQQAVSILLLEDLAIVPLLALVAFLAPAATSDGPAWQPIAIAVAAVAALLAAGRWLLDPMLALLARSRTREVMTAGALLVVLGSALLMDRSGLSMAMGAFFAGVLLSGSSYRHQIETDVEPFKGILLGLFFLAVGMSLDLAVIARDWQLIGALLGAFMLVKAIGIFAVARLTGSSARQSIMRVALFAQGGEFAFVLYAAALTGGLFDAATNARFSAVIILSMALTPLVLMVVERLLPRTPSSADGLAPATDLHGCALVIGFGRFGQIASQALLARGIAVSLIENDPDRIREASRFGFQVFYGDGTRLDILRASGAGEAAVVLVCIDDVEATNHIAALVRAEFPLTRLLVRAWDRGHAIDLVRAGVDYQLRETFESALAFGAAALGYLGVPVQEADELIADLRRRDAERLSLQVVEGIYAGSDLLHGNAHARPVPEPLTTPAPRR